MAHFVTTLRVPADRFPGLGTTSRAWWRRWFEYLGRIGRDGWCPLLHSNEILNVPHPFDRLIGVPHFFGVPMLPVPPMRTYTAEECRPMSQKFFDDIASKELLPGLNEMRNRILG